MPSGGFTIYQEMTNESKQRFFFTQATAATVPFLTNYWLTTNQGMVTLDVRLHAICLTNIGAGSFDRLQVLSAANSSSGGTAVQVGSGGQIIDTLAGANASITFSADTGGQWHVVMGGLPATNNYQITGEVVTHIVGQ